MHKSAAAPPPPLARADRVGAQGKRPWRTPALRLLRGKLSRGKNVTAMTEFTLSDGTALVYTHPGGLEYTIYGPDSAGLS